MNKRKIGDEYEQLAVEYLERNGYRIIERNYRNRIGEIDIIAKEGKTICFVEVKYRNNSKCGYASEAVNVRKQQKIQMVANYYFMRNGYSEWTDCRFDVLAIDGGDITLYRNAFEGKI